MSRIVGVDIGGTFTDLVLFDEASGRITVAKVPSTPADQSAGLLAGIAALGVAPREIGLIVHGTTVATNAVLERKGARCGLLMTEGFRDVLELRRRDRPDTYGLRGQFAPLVPREFRLEIKERVDAKGQVLEEPSDEDVRRAAETLLAKGAEVVVVSFLNAYANGANEQKVRRVLERIWPNPYVVSAADVLPEIREFERTSTAVLNGYVQPLIDRYLSSLMAALGRQGYGADVLLIQSNGGVMSQAVARRYSVNTIMSGPAAGVSAATQIGKAAGESRIITCDVGGTSLDVAVVVDGRPAMARDASLEYGLPIRVPMLDIRSVGAGGGSIARLDRAGLLQIGPQSAGADPGPACYGRGGRLPTVTDANLVLGRINPERPIGGGAGRRLRPELAAQAIVEHVGQPLGLGAVEAAWGILQVANNKIAASIRTLTVEQGYDPRDFALIAYGGGGPLHACALLRELEIVRAVIPPWPGLTSALGCVTANVQHDFVQNANRRLEELDPVAFYRMLQEYVEQGRRLIESERIQVLRVEPRFFADMAYDGQIHEVRTALPDRPCGRDELRRAFESAYAAQYGDTVVGGNGARRAVRLVTARVSVVGIRPPISLAAPVPPDGATLADARTATRPVYFEGGFRDTAVFDRALLPRAAELAGPAIVEQGDTTTVLMPGAAARVDAAGNLIVSAKRS